MAWAPCTTSVWLVIDPVEYRPLKTIELKMSKNNFFQDNSLNYIEMALRTDRIERLEQADGKSLKKGDCGDVVEFFILGSPDRIDTISFMVDGCMNTVACSNTVAEFAEGKSVDQAWDITPEQVIEYLETLDKDHHHCAELSVGSFYLALSDLAPGTSKS